MHICCKLWKSYFNSKCESIIILHTGRWLFWGFWAQDGVNSYYRSITFTFLSHHWVQVPRTDSWWEFQTIFGYTSVIADHHYKHKPALLDPMTYHKRERERESSFLALSKFRKLETLLKKCWKLVGIIWIFVVP